MLTFIGAEVLMCRLKLQPCDAIDFIGLHDFFGIRYSLSSINKNKLSGVARDVRSAQGGAAWKAGVGGRSAGAHFIQVDSNFQ